MGYEDNKIIERLLMLTLKILHLLFEEDYIIMKISGGQFKVSSHSLGLQGRSKTKSPSMEALSHFIALEVLKITNKITELLTREVPIRSQDVTVYFSMEESENLEGHNDLYRLIKTDGQQLLTSSDPRNVDSTCHASNSKSTQHDTDEDYDIDITNTNYCIAEYQMVNKLSTVYGAQIPPLEQHIYDMHVMPKEGKNTALGNIKHVLADHTYSITIVKAKAIMQRLGYLPYLHLESSAGNTQDSPGDKKEDIVLREEDQLPQSDISSYVDSAEFTTVCIKEESYIYKEEHLPQYSSSTFEGCYQDTAAIIKEEPVPCQEFPPFSSTSSVPECREFITFSSASSVPECQEFPPLSSTSSESGQYNFVHIKEEPVSDGEEVPAEIEVFVDGTHCSSDHPKKTGKSKKISSKERPFSCNVCGKLFKQKSGLGRHRKIHVKVERYTCHDCGESFSSLKKLKSHHKCHTNEKPYSCDECGKHFSKLTNLTNHQRIHATKNPFSCAKCGKQFISNANLRRHQKKHEVENTEIATSECGEGLTNKGEQGPASDELYSCAECGRRFIKRINLLKHQRVHTRKNLHHCQECGKCFMIRGYLLRHMKVHSKKRKSCSCTLCGKNFHSKLDLTIHQRIHRGEKPSTASEWRKSFIRKLGFVMQERSNAGEKPYLCSDCGERFEKKLELLRHEKTHNDVKPDVASLRLGFKLKDTANILSTVKQEELLEGQYAQTS